MAPAYRMEIQPFLLAYKSNAKLALGLPFVPFKAIVLPFKFDRPKFFGNIAIVPQVLGLPELIDVACSLDFLCSKALYAMSRPKDEVQLIDTLKRASLISLVSMRAFADESVVQSAVSLYISSDADRSGRQKILSARRLALQELLETAGLDAGPADALDANIGLLIPRFTEALVNGDLLGTDCIVRAFRQPSS